jgi:hypothetical protein
MQIIHYNFVVGLSRNEELYDVMNTKQFMADLCSVVKIVIVTLKSLSGYLGTLEI